MSDPIVDEVRAVREAHAARFNYDLDAIFRDIQEQQRKSGLKFVSYAREATEPILTQTETASGVPASTESGPTLIPAA